jgi:hypothetical protein
MMCIYIYILYTHKIDIFEKYVRSNSLWSSIWSSTWKRAKRVLLNFIEFPPIYGPGGSLALVPCVCDACPQFPKIYGRPSNGGTAGFRTECFLPHVVHSSVWIPTRHAHQPWHRWATLALVSPDGPPCSPSVQRPGSQPPMPQPTASRRRLVLPRRLVARMDCCSWTCWQAPCFPFSAECEGTGKPLLKHWQVPRTCPLHGKPLSKDWQVQRTFPLPLVPFGGQQHVLSSRLTPSLSSLILLLLENIGSATTSCWCCCSLVWTDVNLDLLLSPTFDIFWGH